MKSKNVGMTAGGLVVGAVGAGIVTKQVAKMFPALDKYAGVAPIALGWFLAGMKNDFAKAAGAGMIAQGGASVVGGFIPAIGGGISGDDVLNEDLSEVLTEDLSEVLTEDLSEDFMSEDLTEDLSEDFMSEDLTEDMSEDLA